MSPNQANVALSHCLCQPVIVIGRGWEKVKLMWDFIAFLCTVWCNWLFIYKPKPNSNKKVNTTYLFTPIFQWHDNFYFFEKSTTESIIHENIKNRKNAYIKCRMMNDRFFKIQRRYYLIFKIIVRVFADVQYTLSLLWLYTVARCRSQHTGDAS